MLIDQTVLSIIIIVCKIVECSVSIIIMVGKIVDCSVSILLTGQFI